MDKGAKLLVFIFILISTPLWASCSSSSDDTFEVEEVETYYEEILPSDAPTTTNVFYETYSLNGPVGQSGACYGDYLFIATANLKDIKMYNLRTKSLVYALDTTGFADFLRIAHQYIIAIRLVLVQIFIRKVILSPCFTFHNEIM